MLGQILRSLVRLRPVRSGFFMLGLVMTVNVRLCHVSAV
jgi:hypothetical protein